MARKRKHDTHAAHAPEPAAPRIAWYRRVPWWAVVVTLLVVLTSTCSVEPIRDAVTLGTVGEARLAQPAAYLVIGPLSNVMDTLTLLNVGQHISILLWAIGAFIVWRVLAARRGASAREHVIAASIYFGILIAIYVIGIVAPRPMAQLVISDETVFAVDFHAHTKYSHDGRAGWEPNDVRNWHTGAGYDVAYITDHRTFEGAERGVASNPSQAGEGQGTMLLEGLEAGFHGVHVNVLSAGRRFKGLTGADLRDVDDQALAMGSLLPNNEPVVIQTIPDDLSKIIAAGGPGTGGVRGIELIDGSPRGLSQGRRERARIIHIADSLNLALVAGSDNHGWGRAAPGWTLLRIPDWRGMGTDSLAGLIERVLRLGRRQSTKVVERRVAEGASPLGVVFAGIAVPWRMFTTLSPDERVVWVLWAWAIVLLARGMRFLRVRPSNTA